jgi:hypothetical protein
LALELCFSLPPGSYATMLVRELTKQSSSTQFAKGLSAAANNGNIDNNSSKVG